LRPSGSARWQPPARITCSFMGRRASGRRCWRSEFPACFLILICTTP
jgi:hypothetical protein